MTGQDIISVEMAVESSVSVTKMKRSHFLVISRNNTGNVANGNEVAQEERKRGQEVLRTFMLLKWSILKSFMQSRKLQRVSSYSVLTFETLLSLYFRIPKLAKEFTMTCFSSDRATTGETLTVGKSFVIIRVRVLRVFNPLLSTIENDGKLLETRMNFQKGVSRID